jgi:hypothetical protein
MPNATASLKQTPLSNRSVFIQGTLMKASRLLLTVALSATAAAAMAQSNPLQYLPTTEVEINTQPAYTSSVARSSVAAEAAAAQSGPLAYLPTTEVEVNAFVAEPGTLTRAQVRAEAIEANRLGLLQFNDNDYPVTVTAEQAEQIRLAGLRAVQDDKVAQN